MIDKIKSLFGGSGDGMEDELYDAPLDEEVEQKIEQQEQEIQQLRQEIQKKEQQEDARTARLEERVQEKKREQKKLQSQLQEMQEQMQQVQQDQTGATAATPPPDSKQLMGKPVVSADGNKNFGKFKGWINEGDKIGIKADHPKRDNKIEKVGWADNIRELVMDANSLKDKEIIIVKLNSRGEKVNYVNIHRHQEVVQKKERLEDQKQRLSGENDELIKQNRKLERLNQKLITSMSMDRMESAPDDGSQDLVVSKMANEREMNKQRMDNLAEQNHARRGRVEDVIEEYEQAMDNGLNRLQEPEAKQALEQTDDTVRQVMRLLGGAFDEMDDETREDFMDAMSKNGGAGGAISISDE